MIATAEEIAKKHKDDYGGTFTSGHNDDSVKKAMVEFAQLHVAAALKAASKKARMLQGDTTARYAGENIDKETILNAYSATEIA